MAIAQMTMVRRAMARGCESEGTSEMRVDRVGKSKGGTDCDGHEKERSEWFGQAKRKDETENVRAVVEIKM